MANNNLVEAVVSVTEHDYNMFSAISIHQIEQAKKEENGHKFRWIIPAMVFSAFKLEAMCNSFGSALFPQWEEYEQLKLKGKVLLISNAYELEVDFGVEPWQTINEVIRFRNDLVHSKPRTIKETQTLVKMDNGNLLGALYPNTKARKKAATQNYSIEKAEQFADAVEQVHYMWMHYSIIKQLPSPQFHITKK
ncbi:hypothetical protein [uncultured Neisseria sp.]|uniref:hypothetical protein n=1 Tax=uncultured Neisseria sp. TaxID=237778 RepID=UPI0025F7213C|nr:hypothetical protein [uncultured Neisseria sp.]